MHIDQVSVFLGNHPGRLRHACRLLGDNGVDIKAATIAESKDFGILRLIVDKSDVALKVLHEASFSAECTKVLAVQVADSPGGLAHVLEVIENAGLNIEYMYGFSIRNCEDALMVFRFDDVQKAEVEFDKAGVKTVSHVTC